MRREFGHGYVQRVVDSDLDELLGPLQALLLDGPKGVGKTATALQRCRTVRRLDRGLERTILEADPFLLRADPAPVLIDEWQRLPEVFDTVRRLVDEGLGTGPFLLTGSAPMRSTHSGAGRIATLRMRPLAFAERFTEHPTVSLRELLAGSAKIRGRSELTLADYVDEILAGGFPGMRHLDDRSLQRQLDSYLERIVSHDLGEIGHEVRRPAALRAWLRAYAAATSTTASWEKIRDAATTGVDNKPARSTAVPYVEALTIARILDPVEAWIPSNNHLAALTATSKHHLADPALAARLVRRTASQLLLGAEPDAPVPRDGTFLGALFESLTALSVRTYAEACDARTSHLRTRGGRHEVDLIVERPDGGVVGLEVKLGGLVGDRDVRHLVWLREQLGDECIDTAVVTTGPEGYRRRDGVAVIPLALLGP